jgi:glycosyltransferase involved in cell wall biosynthesis
MVPDQDADGVSSDNLSPSRISKMGGEAGEREDTIELWRTQGQRRLRDNADRFSYLLKIAKDRFEKGRYASAAIFAESAALAAAIGHAGFFASSELERLLVDIGKRAIRRPSLSRRHFSRKLRNVLHVATGLAAVGGHTRMIWNWIQEDQDRVHSLAITRHQYPWIHVPDGLRSVVAATGGRIYPIKEVAGGLIRRAKWLRALACSADLVVLHVSPSDCVPTIAFADKDACPPVALLNHADHCFWVGVATSDFIINLRSSGMNLCSSRRAIEATRSVLLPTVISRNERVLSRADAKSKLGLERNSILLLSVARSIKYRDFDGATFLDAHIPILEKYDSVHLWIIGSGIPPTWSTTVAGARGRIVALDERADTTTFYHAADIYVDSFPFVSNTSLLEAGSYGIPLVTRFPFSRASEILGADMPGLEENLLRASNTEEYQRIISCLVENEKLRTRIGDATKRSVRLTHQGHCWKNSLSKLYELAEQTSAKIYQCDGNTHGNSTEPDILMPSIYGLDVDLDWIIERELRVMPLGQRLFYWCRRMKAHRFAQAGRLGGLTDLLPEGLIARFERVTEV